MPVRRSTSPAKSVDPQQLEKSPQSPEGSEAVHAGEKRDRRGGRQKSCENCRGRKMKCSRTANCAACKMRGETCVWVGAIPDPEPNIGELATAQAEIGRLQTLVDLLMTRLESGPPSPTQQRHHPYARSPKKLLSSGHTVEDAEALLSFANSPTTSPTESFVSPAQFFPLPPTESTSPSFPAPATFPLPPRALPPPSPSPAFPPSSAFQTHFAQPYPIAPTRTAVKTEAAKKHEARYDAAISAFLATRAWEGVAPSLGAGGSTLVGEGRTQLGVTIGDVVAGGMVMGVEQEVRGEVVGQGLVLSDVRNERGQMGEEGREEVMEWKQMARV